MQGYFYGWYLKCQSDSQILAVIPAIHGTGKKRTCSIQVITEDGVWNVVYPENQQNNLGLRKKKNVIRIGKNYFSEKGFRLDMDTPELSVKGKVSFGMLHALKYDIMGPFQFVPFMECRHMVYSMRHPIHGALWVNGKKYMFQNAYGYWEGDRGRSFPKEYAWTQCMTSDGSIMLSVAEIPLAGLHFTGMIGVILWKGREYRLATYLGAKVRQKSCGRLLVSQGKMELETALIEKSEQPLQAPSNGSMVRTIHESAACKAYYRFSVNGQTLFAFETDRASFEYEYEWRK